LDLDEFPPTVECPLSGFSVFKVSLDGVPHSEFKAKLDLSYLMIIPKQTEETYGQNTKRVVLVHPFYKFNVEALKDASRSDFRTRLSRDRETFLKPTHLERIPASHSL
jgi:hypothetical protein